MTAALFSEAWAAALGDALRTSESYRRAARDWDGAVVLEWNDAPPSTVASVAETTNGATSASCGVYLDLQHGECHAARMASSADYADARFVLSADLAAWTTILEGRMAPMMALLRGKLKVTKGSVGALMPHTNAATELVRVAQTIDRAVVAPHAEIASDPVEGANRTQAEPVAATAAATAAATDAPEAVVDGVTRTPERTPERTLQSTSSTGIRFDLLPMRLWEKAKRLGIWNPADIDFTQDRIDWQRLAPDEQDLLLRLTALFQAGEECVTLDILPLLDVVSQEGRLEEQLYLTSFLWEEAKHVEAFRRFFDQVAMVRTDLTHYHTAGYRTIFAQELPAAMGRLRHDRSPIAQARASVTYNMIVEGVLAETGYHSYHRILTERGIMPGMQRVAALLKADESRHLAYGIFLLSRLVVEHGDPVWHAITQRMDELLPPAIAIISESFAAYPADRIPFGLEPDAFVHFATRQFQKRMDRIERARNQTLSQVHSIEETEPS